MTHYVLLNPFTLFRRLVYVIYISLGLSRCVFGAFRFSGYLCVCLCFVCFWFLHQLQEYI